MIYMSSSDPVYLKRVAIRLWRMSDTFYALAKKYLEVNPSGNVDEFRVYLKNFYEKSLLVSNFPHLVSQGGTEGSADAGAPAPADSGGGGDDLADLMGDVLSEAAAMADGEEATEETPDEEASAPEEEASSEESPSEEEPVEEENKIENLLEFPLFDNPNVVVEGQVILSDISMGGMSFFAKSPLIIGQSIMVEFLIPNAFTICATIASCYDYNSSTKIISGVRPQYRLTCSFPFDRQGERTILRNFLQSIEVEVVAEDKDKKKKSGDDDDDDVDNLEDLL